MLKLCQRSKDELFSIALYNWLIQADLTDKLLQVKMVFYSNIINFPVGKVNHSSDFLVGWESLDCELGDITFLLALPLSRYDITP